VFVNREPRAAWPHEHLLATEDQHRIMSGNVKRLWRT
jgi:hypothetical protein